MTPPDFDRFVAVDWTGAKGTRHRAIQVAEAHAGESAPRLVRPAHVWSRDEVRALIQSAADAGQRSLFGIDCSFSLPFVDAGAFFPSASWTDAKAVWQAVEEASRDEGDLAAAGFIAAHRAHFWCGAADGPRAPFDRVRVAERVHRERRMGHPCSPFVLVGASQVGKATLTGMRLLAQLDGVAVWPFDAVPEAGPLVVEIYCQTLALDGGFRGKIRSRADLNVALQRLGSNPVGRAVPASFPDHVGDALVSAAGLRRAAQGAAYWAPPHLTEEVRRTEGWTFGIL